MTQIMRTPSVQHLIKKYGIRPRKKFGQHFLAAPPTIEKIVRTLGADKGDVVVEIGSGLGVMTALLSQQCKRVFAIEHDENMLVASRAEFGHIKNITWVESDILSLDLARLTDSKVKIAGNLPYNISSPIIFWMIENRGQISTAEVMLQKEVAQRLIASPNCGDYGILSVLLRAFAECKKLFDVSAGSFIPQPKVTSSVIKIDFDRTKIAAIDWPALKTVVKAAFGRRRKTLRNALTHVLAPPSVIDNALAAVKIDGRRRPETLSVDEFIKLSRRLTASKSEPIRYTLT